MNEKNRVSIEPEDVKPEEAKRVLSILNAAEEAQKLADVIEIPGRRDVGVSVARSILDRRDQLGGEVRTAIQFFAKTPVFSS